MLSILLEKKEHMKLEIFKHLLNSIHPRSTKELSSFFKITSATLTRYINELSLELSDFPAENVQLIERPKGHYAIINNLSINSISIFEELRLSYFEKLIEFQLISLLLEKRFFSFTNLASKLLISESYLYKVIKKIQPILLTFKLELNLENDGPYNFNGKVLNLRFFAYTFTWFSYKNIKWPPAFKEISKMNLENSMRLVYKEEKPSITIPSSNRFYFILTIIMKYPSSSLDLDTTLKEFVEPLTVANYLPSSFLSCFFSDSFKHINNSSLSEETVFLNYALHLLVPDIYSEKDKEAIGLACKNSNIYKEFSLPFLQSIADYFSLTLSHSHINTLLYYTNLYALFLYIDIDIIDLFRPHPTIPLYGYPDKEPNPISFEIGTYWAQFSKSSHLLLEVSNSHKNVMYDFIYFIITTLSRPKLVIFINYSTSLHGTEFLTTEIVNFFGTDIITIASEPDQADVIISDTHEVYLTEGQELFFTKIITGPDSWEKLLTYLHNKMFNLKFRYIEHKPTK